MLMTQIVRMPIKVIKRILTTRMTYFIYGTVKTCLIKITKAVTWQMRIYSDLNQQLRQLPITWTGQYPRIFRTTLETYTIIWIAVYKKSVILPPQPIYLCILHKRNKRCLPKLRSKNKRCWKPFQHIMICEITIINVKSTNLSQQERQFSSKVTLYPIR